MNTPFYGYTPSRHERLVWKTETLMLLSVPLPIVVNFGSTGMIYVGQVTGTDMPDGHGYMYQPNGDL